MTTLGEKLKAYDSELIKATGVLDGVEDGFLTVSAFTLANRFTPDYARINVERMAEVVPEIFVQAGRKDFGDVPGDVFIVDDGYWRTVWFRAGMDAENDMAKAFASIVRGDAICIDEEEYEREDWESRESIARNLVADAFLKAERFGYEETDDCDVRAFMEKCTEVFKDICMEACRDSLEEFEIPDWDWHVERVLDAALDAGLVRRIDDDETPKP